MTSGLKIAITCFTSLLILNIGYSDLLAQQSGTTMVARLRYTAEIKLNDRWDLNSRLQLRSGNRLKKLSDLNGRVQVEYAISNLLSAGLHYRYSGSLDSDSEDKGHSEEFRAFQQVESDSGVIGFKWLSHRLRFEERFFTTERPDPFSLRARYAIEWEQKIGSNSQRNYYMTLENELFFNLIGRQSSGNRFLDQNRISGGVGCSLNPRTTLEFGTHYRIRNNELSSGNPGFILQFSVESSF